MLINAVKTASFSRLTFSFLINLLFLNSLFIFFCSAGESENLQDKPVQVPSVPVQTSRMVEFMYFNYLMSNKKTDKQKKRHFEELKMNFGNQKLVFWEKLFCHNYFCEKSSFISTLLFTSWTYFFCILPSVL